MKSDTDKVLSFLHEARQLQLTYRFTPKPDKTYESDAEHSWSVALICMLLASRLEKEFGVEINQLKLLQMALIHDMAEIRTGDTKTWDTKARENKEEKERIAFYDMTKKLPNDLKDQIRQLWEECEERETLEAKIVKSVDRLDPVIHRTVLGVGWENVINDGVHGTAFALDSRQLPRHSFSSTLTELYSKIRDEAVQKDMFIKDQS